MFAFTAKLSGGKNKQKFDGYTQNKMQHILTKKAKIPK